MGLICVLVTAALYESNNKHLLKPSVTDVFDNEAIIQLVLCITPTSLKINWIGSKSWTCLTKRNQDLNGIAMLMALDVNP